MDTENYPVKAVRITQEMLDNLLYNLRRYQAHVEETHDVLDWMGVPREITPGQIARIPWRLEWLKEHLPHDWEDVVFVAREEHRRQNGC